MENIHTVFIDAIEFMTIPIYSGISVFWVIIAIIFIYIVLRLM